MEVEHFVVRYDHMKENFAWSFKEARFLSLERKISLSRNAIRILMRKFWSQNASMKEALLPFHSMCSQLNRWGLRFDARIISFCHVHDFNNLLGMLSLLAYLFDKQINKTFRYTATII